jgi:hypothetical protein
LVLKRAARIPRRDLVFVPASAYGFERQAVRRGQPLYQNLLEKIRSLTVVHADETTWRHDGQPYWVAHHELTARPWRAKAAKIQERNLRRPLRKLCRQPLRYPKAEKFRRR